MDVHASDGGGVAVERVDALARLGVPNFESPIRGAGNDDVLLHLRGPDSARVPDQSAQAFPGLRRPNLQDVRGGRVYFSPHVFLSNFLTHTHTEDAAKQDFDPRATGN